MMTTKSPPTDPLLIIGPDLFAHSLAALLADQGFHPTVCGTANDELAACAFGPTPAAILLDLLLARREDFALLRRLRSFPCFATVRILVLSSGTLGGERTALERQLQAFGVRPLLEPHDLDDILAELSRSVASVA